MQAQKEGTQVFDFLSADNAMLEAEKKYRDESGSNSGFSTEQLAMLEQQEAITNER